MKMDDKSLPLCSQSFFVSQRTGPNKLSLTMKSLSKSKNSTKNRGRKSIRSQGSVKTRTSSGPHTRCGGKGSHSGTMELYFGGAKDPGTSCFHINENDGPSTPGTSGFHSFPMDSHFPPAEDSIPKFNEDSRLSAVVKDSCKGDDSSECDSIVEAQATESIALHDNDPIDGARTTDQTKEDRTDVLMCPICWKSFESKDTQTAHMKLCAAKHKMSTKQLLDALELVQRQEAERKSLGLPLLANKIFKKPKKEPSQTSDRPKTASDGYLQLGLALSASLIEAEKEKERNHLLEAGLVEEANEKGLLPTQEISESIPAKPAPIFLNVGKKSGDEVRDTNKARRRNAKYNFGGRVPAILRRTAEERERLITEKVAVILVGDDAVDSSKSNPSNGPGNSLSTWNIRSKEMKNFVDKENTWWMLAGLSPSSVSQDQYYVNNLNGFISPSKVVAGAKLKHLSQIPGRNNTPGKTPVIAVPEQEKIWSLSSVKNVSGPIESHQHSSKKLSVKRNLFSESPEANPRSSLSNDWNLLVGKKEMSDITIFTQEDHEIPAHKLVFYVRCPSILKDLVQERRGNETSEMLVWNEACYLAVMAFLKFIYADELPEASTLENFVIEDFKKLCAKYHLCELLTMLEKNSIPCESSKYFVMRKAATHTKMDLPAVQKRKISVPNCKIDSTHSKTVSPKVSNYEELSLSGQEIHETKIDIKSPEIIKDDCENDFDNVIVRSSTSPIVRLPDSSSPDVFLGSNTNLSYSSKRSIVVDEVLTVNETLEDSSLFESSRSSIDYLVSLMEKDSKSSDIIMEPQGSVSGGSIARSIPEIPNNSKTLNCTSNLIALGNDIDQNSPVTPSSLNKTGDILVYPTPVPGERNPDRIAEISVTQHSNLLKDPKRKLQNSDDSESSTPTSKKVCLIDNDGDSLAIDGASTDEKEVVDLTLSSPDGEDAPENDPLNCSNISTIPPPPEEEPCAFGEEKEDSIGSDSIPDNCHISNIWEGFENISDGGYVVTNGLGLDPENDSVKSVPLKDSGDRCIGPESDSVKSIPLMDSEDATSCVSPVSDKCINVVGPKKNIDVIHEIYSSEDADSIGGSACMRNEDKKQDLETPLHGIAIGGNDVDDVDITEKLLNVSLQKINDSIFWRDENEPVEGLNGVKSLSSTPKTPLESKVHANASNKETPVNSSGSKFIRSANVTPLADFSAMKTPTLHKELDRYGIKHLKRNQAKKILRHIYNELHPIVSTSNECNENSSDVNAKKTISSDVSAKIPVVQSSKGRHGSSRPKKDPNIRFALSSDEGSSPDDSSGSDSDSVIFEESMCEQMESPLKEMTLSQRASAVDLPTGMKILIERNPELHKRILLYEPLWLNDIKLALKEVGAKFNANQLMNYLDEQCITFRLAPGNRHRRKKAPKEKSIPLSQPCRSRSKGCRSISSSQPC
ncbi:uncharacterized protein LOC124157643 [Ischnura elegans]|uniref:uncharacterized protein LOC124157643 n=1 Tax=Ischnura elegans TaxID=197161 RepID=UPI001ED8AC24|nr:uncharacterized protein LOC124157643 [Ischnura elegans]